MGHEVGCDVTVVAVTVSVAVIASGGDWTASGGSGDWAVSVTVLSDMSVVGVDVVVVSRGNGSSTTPSSFWDPLLGGCCSRLRSSPGPCSQSWPSPFSCSPTATPPTTPSSSPSPNLRGSAAVAVVVGVDDGW